jgi:hypothetical protein
MSGERLRKAERRATHASATGNHLDAAEGRTQRADVIEAFPKVMIFSSRKRTPPSGAEISICANAEICAMYVRVCAIRVDEVARSKAIRGFRPMFAEAIHADDPGDGFDIHGGKGELIEQPCFRDTTVRIGIRKPMKMGGTCASRNGHLGREGACFTYDSAGCTYNNATALKHVLRKGLRGVGRAIIDNDYVTRDIER